MPSIINATTTNGVAVSGDNSGALVLATNNNTAAVTITTGQQFQVNTGGSVSAPVISKSDDTNTGIYFSAADTIDFAEGGVATGQFDSSGNFKFNSGYGSVTTAYGCRAWVNFNGTGTVTIRASGNVTSITDNGTGLYTVNFTTAMPDANYSITGFCQEDSGGGLRCLSGTGTPTSSARPIETRNSGNTLIDPQWANIAVFR